MTDRSFGGWRVTAISDGTFALPPDKLLGLDAAATAVLPASIPLEVYGFLLQGHGRTVLVDAGAGTTMGPTLGRLADALRDAGVAPEQVDTVLLTHIHPDHSGGLLRPDGAAQFPAARVLVPAGERAFWLDPEPEDALPPMRPYLRAARAVAAAYAGRMGDAGDAALPGVDPVPLPGHTPGHTGYRIGSGADALLIWGDVMHVADIQAARPEIGLSFDVDGAEAIATRRRALDNAAEEGFTVAGMHLNAPGFARVERAGPAFRMVPA